MNRNRYKWYVVGMLWWAAFFDYADRLGIFSVFPLLEKEMHLSPIQLGLLGSTFAWVYGLGAPFAGYVVDRIRRKTAILGGLFTWSTVTVAAILSRTFGNLFSFMVTEAVSEAIYIPACMSMLSDYHGKATRSKALGILQTSVYMGTIGGGFLAGLIAQKYGWRCSFVVLGTAGLVLATILLRVLREPLRGAAEGENGTVDLESHALARVSVGQSLKLILGTPSAVMLMGSFMCANFVALVLLSWMPKFLYDKFHLSLAMAGLSATLFAQVASMVGAPVGGWLADIAAKRMVGGRVLVQAIAVFCGVPFVFLWGRANSIRWVIVALAAWGLSKGLYDANSFASVFDVVPPQVRGTAAGFLNMTGFLGGGSAPLIIGFVAQRVGISWAISLAAIAYALAGVLLATSLAGFIRKDVARVEQFVRTSRLAPRITI
jgi:MFS family permease